MSIRELRCPECNAALQPIHTSNDSFFACKCGYGEHATTVDDEKGIVSYMQAVGNKTLTLLSRSDEYA